MKFYQILFLLLSLIFSYGNAQKFSVSGVLYDHETKETMPLVGIFFDTLGTLGTNTNLDGEYQISLPPGKYQMMIKYSGYKIFRDTIVVTNQNIRKDIYLEPMSFQIEEIVITAKDNPGLRVMKQAIKNKKANNMNRFEAYEYRAYNKMVASLDNISEDKLDKLYLKPIKKFVSVHQQDSSLHDTLPNKYKLAVFISESISRVYHKKTQKVREVIEATQTTGVQNPETNLLSNFMTSMNFYDNYLSIMGKQFISPLADGATLNYKYELKGIETIDQDTTYFIEIIPRNKFDYAFHGMMHIRNKSWAIVRLDLKISSNHSINFVENLRIRQQFQPFDGQWLPIVSDIEVDFKNKETNLGIIGRNSTTMTDYVLNQPKPDSFFEDASVEVSESSVNKDADYWKENRLSPLEKSEEMGYALVDSLKTLTFWKVIQLTSEFLTTGRRKFKYFEIGNYSQVISFNAVEGLRNRIGIYTLPALSNRWYAGAHIAYGHSDKKFKYDVDFLYKHSRKSLFQIGLQRTQELEQTGYPDYVNVGTGLMTSMLFRVPLTQQNYFTENHFKVSWDIRRGISSTWRLTTKNFSPARTFAFSYLDAQGVEKSTYNNTEFAGLIRISFREDFLMKAGQKVYVGSKYPIFYIEGTLGFPNHLGRKMGMENDFNGDFRYQKLGITMSGELKFGRLGHMLYTVTAGNYWGSAPYPLLYVFRGSQSYAFDPMGVNIGSIASMLGSINRSTKYDPVGFNLMYYYEFIADRWVVLGLDHHFEGFFLRKIPLVRKLKLKELFTFRAGYGTLSENNKRINNTSLQTIQSPDIQPYMEIGTGIENILKVMRLDFLWRLNYKNPQAPERIAKYNYNYGLRVNVSIGF